MKKTLSQEREERRQVVLKQMAHHDMIARIQLRNVPALSIEEWVEHRGNVLAEIADKTAMGSEKKHRLYEYAKQINNWIEIAKRISL